MDFSGGVLEQPTCRSLACGLASIAEVGRVGSQGLSTGPTT